MPEKTFPCPACPKVFTSANSLWQHCKERHPKLGMQKPPKKPKAKNSGESAPA